MVVKREMEGQSERRIRRREEGKEKKTLKREKRVVVKERQRWRKE